MKQAVLVVCATVALGAPAFAQEAVKADPKHYKVVAENERLRVLKASYGAGDKSVMHEHPDTFAVFLTEAKVRFTLADGKSVEATRKAGDAMADPAVKHLPENIGAAAMEVILVEVKPGAPRPAPVAGAVPPPAGGKITRTQIVSGPHGEVALLKAQPGYEEPAGSKHDYDAVVVPMTDSGATLAMGGKTVTMKKGQAYLIPRGAEHGVKANADGETVVVYIK
jgi:quercetin dioxygenase-like cupin family protein